MARVMAKARPKPTPTSRPFKTFAFVSKAYEDEKGDWWLEGIASGSALDAHGERMSPECVQDMGAQLNSAQIRLLQTHFNDWEGVLGWIKSGEVNLAGLLVIRCWLDKLDSAVQKLWRQLQGDPSKGIEPAKLGLSVGGWLVDGHSEIIDGDYVFTIDKLQLDHVAVTSRPANPEAWITDIEAKQKAYARPWLQEIAKAASADMRTPRGKGGTTVDPEELDEEKPEDAPAEHLASEDPAPESGPEAEKAAGIDIEAMAKSIIDVTLEAVEELLKSKGTGPKLKYMRANDLIGDEMVAVKDEEAEAAENEADDDGEEEPDPEDPAEEDEPEGKSRGRVTVSKELLAAARLKARQARDRYIALKAQDEAKGGEPIRKGLHDAAGDEALAKQRQGTDAKKGNWVEELRKTEDYKKARPGERIKILREQLPVEMRKCIPAPAQG